VKVSVIGLGYVGSVAAAGLATAGHDVLGIDLDSIKIDAYRRGYLPFYEPGLGELINAACQRRKLRFLLPDEVSEPLGEAIIIATGTPMTDSGSVNLDDVKFAISWIKGKEPAGSVILMKSTVPPGAGMRFLETILSDSPCDYVSNPEFLREGQAVADWFKPSRIVVGVSRAECVPVLKVLFQGIDAPYLVTDITSAEMIKYAANAFLATKISFINEIAMLCDRVGATIDDIAKGISLDPRIGPSFLKAGVGYGGSCFPKDTRALHHLASSNGHDFELLRSVIRVNNRQRLLPLYALRERFGPLLGVKVSVLGLAFKPHTDDIRESPAIDLIHLLAQEGAEVKAYDPKALIPARKVVPKSVSLAEDLLDCTRGAQALVLMTEWPEIVEADWERIASSTMLPRFLFDGRNALDPVWMQELGFQYCGVGRGAVSSVKVIASSPFLANPIDRGQ
jgi:UDPglucose 6-dehydrogenase